MKIHRQFDDDDDAIFFRPHSIRLPKSLHRCCPPFAMSAADMNKSVWGTWCQVRKVSRVLRFDTSHKVDTRNKLWT